MLPGLNFLSDAYFATLKVICYFLDACFKVYSKFVCLAKSDILGGANYCAVCQGDSLIWQDWFWWGTYPQKGSANSRRDEKGAFQLVGGAAGVPEGGGCCSHIDQIRKAFHLENLKTKSACFKKQLFGSRFKVLHLLNNSKVFCCNCHHH